MILSSAGKTVIGKNTPIKKLTPHCIKLIRAFASLTLRTTAPKSKVIPYRGTAPTKMKANASRISPWKGFTPKMSDPTR